MDKEGAQISMETCHLCEKTTTLMESHIIPAFAFRWLRRTGLTQHIRRADRPNKRVQDGWKVKMLCAKCEQRLGKLEKKFAEKIFGSIANNGQITFVYDRDFHQLWISIAWRYLVAKRIENGLSYFAQQKLTEIRSYKWRGKHFKWAEAQLKKSLVDECETLEVHLLPIGIFRDGVPEGAPDNINRHVDRAIELDICFTQVLLLLYIKIGPFIAFINLRNETLPWVGSQIKFEGGNFPANKVQMDQRILRFIFERAKNAKSVLQSISKEQQSRIRKSRSKIDDMKLDSGMFEAMRRDAGIFGIDSISDSEGGD